MRLGGEGAGGREDSWRRIGRTVVDGDEEEGARQVMKEENRRGDVLEATCVAMGGRRK